MKLQRGDIFLLYVVQGLPFGFQADICPLILKSWGYSYKSLGLINLTILPWMLKPFIGPLFEHAGSELLLACLCSLIITHIGIWLASCSRDASLLAAMLFTSNICAAAYDIIVDKCAIIKRAGETENEADLTNSVQVVGYKLGAAVSGSVLMSVVLYFMIDPYAGLMFSPIISAVLTAAFATRLYSRADRFVNSSEQTIMNDHPRTYDFVTIIINHFKSNIALYVLILSYKAGETIGDKLFKLFLQDSGMNLSDITTLNIWNDFVSILGSLCIAIFPRNRTSDKSNLLMALLLNTLPQMLRYFVVRNSSFRRIYLIFIVSTIEHFVGGSVTVALFNFMFSSVDKNIKGTHYSVYASLEVSGKLFVGSFALYLVPLMGFDMLFVVAVILSMFPAFLLYKYSPPSTAAVAHSRHVYSKKYE